MDQLKYEPRIKMMIRDAVFDFLYDPTLKQFKTRLDTIIVRNAILLGHGHKSFTYKGQQYSCDTLPAPRGWNRLLPQLRPEMDEYLEDVKRLNQNEVPFVLGYINQVLNASNDFGDYLRLLPECIHRPIEKTIHSHSFIGKRLDEERLVAIKEQNTASINLIKQRMVTNLLI